MRGIVQTENILIKYCMNWKDDIQIHPRKLDNFRKIIKILDQTNREYYTSRLRLKKHWKWSWMGSPSSWKSQRSKKNWNNSATRFSSSKTKAEKILAAGAGSASANNDQQKNVFQHHKNWLLEIQIEETRTHVPQFYRCCSYDITNQDFDWFRTA